MSQMLFISDLHLSADRPATLALFLSFLAREARDAAALYILGDLFDSWIGDDDDSELAEQVRRGLRQLRGHTPVYFQHGNRDFLIGDQFCEQTGVELLPETAVLDISGQPTLLMHGDLLCTDDSEYQKARGLLRNPAFIADFLAKTLAERSAVATDLRKRSGEATSMKAADIMDVNQQAVEQYLRKHEASRLIHGHTHRPGTHQFDLDGKPAERQVLAEWHEDQGMALIADPGLHRETYKSGISIRA